MEPPPSRMAVGGGRKTTSGWLCLTLVPRRSWKKLDRVTAGSYSLALVSRRLSLLLILALALLGCALISSSAGAARFYTPDYGSKTPEEIGGFDLGSDGSLTPIPGSPFPAEEPGLGGLWGLAFSPDGTRAMTGFYFTGGVQAFTVPPSGIFQLAGSAIPAASATSVAISPDGRFAFASTREFMAMPAEGIRRFAFNADGTLMPLSPPGGAGEYEDIAITPDGRFLFAMAANKIERFAIAGDGSLEPLGTTSSPPSRSLAMAPDGRFLFGRVSGGSTSGVVSFAIGADGGLQQVGEPALIPDSFVRVFTMAPDGHHLYLADSNQAAVQAIAIAGDGTPSVVGSMPIENPESVGVSPDGRFLVYYRGGGAEDALGVASIGSDGVPVALDRETPWSSGEPEPIVFQPHPVPTARAIVEQIPSGLTFHLSGAGSERATSYRWDFGDGSRLDSASPATTHTYTKGGVYQVTLTVADESGCSTEHVYDGHSTICPGGESAAASLTVDTPPLLGKPKAVPKKFAPKGKGGKGGGTSFRYTVNEAATVRFKIERKKIGRLVGKKCKLRTPKNAKRKKCPIFKLAGSRSQNAKPGPNSLKWNGKLKGKALSPGSYRAIVVATDQAGGRSAPQTVGFRILPLPKRP
jgi:6-phosphogluconolactonase